MTRVLWTPQARGDLRGIREYIGHDSPHSAALVVAEILTSVVACGSSRSPVGSFRNEVIWRNYRIVYRHMVSEREVHVLLVFRAERLLPKLDA